MTAERFPIPNWLLLRIAARDGWRCRECEQGYLSGETWEVDHDVPLARGGTNHVNNLRLLHGGCNRGKAAA